jgi:TonB family protein
MMLHKKSSSRRLLKLIALVPIVGIALALNAKTVTDVVYTNDAAKELVKSEFKADTIQTPNPPLSNDGAASFKTLPYIIEGEEADGDAKDKVYDVVEEMPQFPGGIGKMMEYLAVNLRYPKEAEEKGLQGRVIANFVIEPDGSITNAKVVKPLDPALDAEALRLVNAMPKWTPGKQGGVPMRVKYTIPITFRLDNGPAIPALKDQPANQGPEVVAMAHRSETAKSGTQEEQPLVFVDNKEVPFEQLGKIDPKTIDHMDVLKGKSGTEKYGAKGKNGVVLITTKK